MNDGCTDGWVKNSCVCAGVQAQGLRHADQPAHGELLGYCEGRH